MDANTAVQVLPYLEGSKFNSANDLLVTSVALKLTFEDNKAIWDKGSKEREILLSFISGEIIFARETFSNANDVVEQNVIKFFQGLLIIAISIVDGMGRAPLSLQSSDDKCVILRSSANSITVDIGQFNDGTESLIREFKANYYGTVATTEFTKDDLAVIVEAFQETVDRFKTEIDFMGSVAQDPLTLWREQKNFASLFFVLVAALPAETLNAMFMEIASYLPEGIQIKNENGNLLDLKNYFGIQTVETKELFNKVRLLLRNYFGQQREILGMIVRENIKVFFEDILQSDNVKKEIAKHINETIADQFETRKTIFESFIKLLK